jgi:hypothetical protein
LEEKVAVPVYKTEIMDVRIRHADHVAPYIYIYIYISPQKLALTSPTSGGRSVGVVRSWTKATECAHSNAELNLKALRRPES